MRKYLIAIIIVFSFLNISKANEFEMSGLWVNINNYKEFTEGKVMISEEDMFPLFFKIQKKENNSYECKIIINNKNKDSSVFEEQLPDYFEFTPLIKTKEGSFILANELNKFNFKFYMIETKTNIPTIIVGETRIDKLFYVDIADNKKVLFKKLPLYTADDVLKEIEYQKRVRNYQPPKL